LNSDDAQRERAPGAAVYLASRPAPLPDQPHDAFLTAVEELVRLVRAGKLAPPAGMKRLVYSALASLDGAVDD
jgi:hypothetical protein